MVSVSSSPRICTSHQVLERCRSRIDQTRKRLDRINHRLVSSVDRLTTSNGILRGWRSALVRADDV